MSFTNNSFLETITNPIIMFPQFLFIQYLVIVLTSVWFNYLSTYNKEEVLIDADYLLTSILVESEKEITAIEDSLLTSVILIYVFGWYFYIHC